MPLASYRSRGRSNEAILRDVILETPRLRLRELVEDDWRDLLAVERDASVNRYQGYDPFDEQRARAAVQAAIAAAAQSPRVRVELAITLRDQAALIGRGGLLRSGHELAVGELFVTLAPAYHRGGLVTEAGRAFLAFAFDTLGMHRIVGVSDPRNVASLRLMETLGMRREGHLRQDVWAKGEWCDSVVYAILASERSR